MERHHALACRLISRRINSRLKGTSFSDDIKGDLFLSVYEVVLNQTKVDANIDEPLLQDIVNKKVSTEISKISSTKIVGYISASEAEAERKESTTPPTKRLSFQISIEADDDRILKEASQGDNSLTVTEKVDTKMILDYVTTRLPSMTFKQREIIHGIMNDESTAEIAARCNCTEANIRQIRAELLKSLKAECS